MLLGFLPPVRVAFLPNRKDLGHIQLRYVRIMPNPGTLGTEYSITLGETMFSDTETWEHESHAKFAWTGTEGKGHKCQPGFSIF